MSETRSKDGSPTRSVDLDDALRRWPEAQKTEAEWEQSAQTVLDGVRSERAGARLDPAAEEKLFAVPLSENREEGHNSAARTEALGEGSRALGSDKAEASDASARARAEGSRMSNAANRERDRRSLQDLAKMAQLGQLTPPPPSVMPQSGVHRALEAKADDSGIVDLAAAAAADPEGAARAQHTPLANVGLFDEAGSFAPPASGGLATGGAAGLVRPAGLAQPYPSLPPVPGSVPPPAMANASAAPSAAPASIAPPSAAPAKRGRAGAVVGVVVSALVGLSAAAAGVLYLRTHVAAPAAAPVAEAPAPPAEAVAAPETPAAVAETAPAEPAAAAATTEAPGAVDELDEPAATSPAARKGAVHKGRATAAAKAPRAEGTRKDEPPKLTQKDLPPPPPVGPSGALGEEIAKRVDTPKEPTPTPAAATTARSAAGNVPQKPSQGAVTGAINSVLPMARGCLGPDEPISRATIVFTSEGAVQAVRVTGHAAGKPTEACIKTALSKARLTPFAEPTYSAPVTIRPL